MRLALLSMVVGVFALASLDYGLNAVLTFSQVGPLVDLEASLNTTFIVAFPVAFLVGLAVTLALVSARVALTAAAPLAHQSRVFALQATLTDSFVVLPLLLMGIGVEVAGARPVLAAMGLIGALTFVFIQLPRFMPIPLLLHPHTPGPELAPPTPRSTDRTRPAPASASSAGSRLPAANPNGQVPSPGIDNRTGHFVSLAFVRVSGRSTSPRIPAALGFPPSPGARRACRRNARSSGW